MLPNHRLLARAFHRIPSNISSSTRQFSLSRPSNKWEGRTAEENTTREGDEHNVQHDAVKAGKEDKAAGQGGSATSESAGMAGEEGSDHLNKKAEKDNKEAPKPVIGMNDERGGKGH